MTYEFFFNAGSEPTTPNRSPPTKSTDRAGSATTPPATRPPGGDRTKNYHVVVRDGVLVVDDRKRR